MTKAKKTTKRSEIAKRQKKASDDFSNAAIKSIIGNPIEGWLEKNGKTKTWLADEIGARFQAVSSWVNGHHSNLRADQIVKIVYVTGIPHKDLIQWAAFKALTEEGWFKKYPQHLADFY